MFCKGSLHVLHQKLHNRREKLETIRDKTIHSTQTNGGEYPRIVGVYVPPNTFAPTTITYHLARLMHQCLLHGLEQQPNTNMHTTPAILRKKHSPMNEASAIFHHYSALPRKHLKKLLCGADDQR